MKRAIIIGFGNIGKALKVKIDNLSGWDVGAVVRREGLCDNDGRILGELTPLKFQTLIRSSDATMVFIATPSDGSAMKYMECLSLSGVPFVSCEKWALSHFFDTFGGNIDKFGWSAMVGGGTRFLPSLKERLRGREDMVVHAVVNGTLNFVFHSMHHDGDSLGIAIDKAKSLGYAEPGATDPLAVLNGEMLDTAMKTAIAYNICMRKEQSLNAQDIKITPLDEEGLSSLVRQAAVRRYIVSFFPPELGEKESCPDLIGGFSHTIEGWKICAGFQRTDTNPIFKDRLPMGANNCVITCEGVRGEDGIYVLGSGPGAGPNPTAASMLSDARRLLNL